MQRRLAEPVLGLRVVYTNRILLPERVAFLKAGGHGHRGLTHVPVLPACTRQ